MPIQLPLLGGSIPAIDRSFRGLRRISLDTEAWVDHLPGWLKGQRHVFDALNEGTSWQEAERTMYDGVVPVPRLTACLPQHGLGHPMLFTAADWLGDRYGVVFDRIGLALYRDGTDSVAWHRDQVLREHHSAFVATVSMGEPRRFMLRPHGGGRSISLNLGWGDLVVMGGSCQRTWEHCVPKARYAAPRMSVMFRHSRPLGAVVAA